MYFNELLTKKRVEKNLTMSELARLVGCSQGSVSQWEAGVSVPSAKYLLKLSEIFDYDFSVVAAGGVVGVVSPIEELVENLDKTVLNLSETNLNLSETLKKLMDQNTIILQRLFEPVK